MAIKHATTQSFERSREEHPDERQEKVNQKLISHLCFTPLSRHRYRFLD
jgi:hypothetical protein